MEKRLTELETKVTFQEQIIEDLNQRIIEQQKQIDKFLLEFNIKIDPATTSNIVDVSLEVPPPHY